MPVLSCGGMRYQHKWQDVPLAEVPPENQANLEACIRRVLDAGVNHIETARGYGSSERQLGEILPGLPREKMIVQTKIAPEADPQQFVKNFEDSLARLKLAHVDLLALHGVNNEETLEWSLRPGGCLAAAREIQKRGLARHIGFSTHAALPLILRAIGHENDGGFDYVNLHWYYIFQRNWPAVQAATKRDMGVFIISPTDKGGMLYDAPARLTELCEPLHPIVFNDLFCLSRPEIHTISVGMAKPADLDLHLRAVELLGQAAEWVRPIEKRLNEAYAAAVPSAVRDVWGLNLPEWERVPGGVNVPIILWLSNLVAAFDMHKYGQMRYNLLGNGGHWFPGKNAGEMDEIAIKTLLDTTGQAERILATLRNAHQTLGAKAVKRLSEGG